MPPAVTGEVGASTSARGCFPDTSVGSEAADVVEESIRDPNQNENTVLTCAGTRVTSFPPTSPSMERHASIPLVGNASEVRG